MTQFNQEPMTITDPNRLLTGTVFSSNPIYQVTYLDDASRREAERAHNETKEDWERSIGGSQYRPERNFGVPKS